MQVYEIMNHNYCGHVLRLPLIMIFKNYLKFRHLFKCNVI